MKKVHRIFGYLKRNYYIQSVKPIKQYIMTMTINTKVKSLFAKSFTWFTHYMTDVYLKNTILSAMQKAYDLGHSDGYAECYFDEHPELENQ